MTTAAAIDRLVHHSVIVELNVPELPPGNRQETRRNPLPNRPRSPAKT